MRSLTAFVTLFSLTGFSLEPLKQITPYPDTYTPEYFSSFNQFEETLLADAPHIIAVDNDAALTDVQKKTKKDEDILRKSRCWYTTLAVDNVDPYRMVISKTIAYPEHVMFYVAAGVDANTINKGDRVLMFFVVDDVDIRVSGYTMIGKNGKPVEMAGPPPKIGAPTTEARETTPTAGKIEGLKYTAKVRYSNAVFYLEKTKLRIDKQFEHGRSMPPGSLGADLRLQFKLRSVSP